MISLHSLVLLWGGPQHWNGELLLSQLGIQQTIKSAIEHIETRSYSNHKHMYMVNGRFIHNETPLLSLLMVHMLFHSIAYPPPPSPSFLLSLIHFQPQDPPSFFPPSSIPPKVTPLLLSPFPFFPPSLLFPSYLLVSSMVRAAIHSFFSGFEMV